ncbi:ATP-binding cassette transporter [Athelia psychrophila]|uniref:ATP-binding cassette transporter n=1 Tax=Athelia psychrophila TaxID=1759441 RepID=A0A166AUD5_9AGAM|nr:ATP-binding cassette transporter [Fibularhizoctonia sp. CBS 109695]
MSKSAVLEIRNLTCPREKDTNIFSNLSFTVNEGDIVVLQGKSGSGKTTLLKCLAHLNVYTGSILYRENRTPKSYGIPFYRTRVFYVPQRTSLLPGTPREFLNLISSFKSRKPSTTSKHHLSTDIDHPIDVSKSWGIEADLWDRDWSTLSGGEAQRIALAAAVGLNVAEVLLLDEPTSALDPESAKSVEDFLINELKSAESALKAIIWITHSEEQGHRVGTRHLHLTPEGCQEEVVQDGV